MSIATDFTKAQIRRGNKRLLELADHLSKPKRGLDSFDFRYVCHLSPVGKRGCGTSGCAMGEMPLLWPKNWQYQDLAVHSKASDFGRPKRERNHLRLIVDESAASHGRFFVELRRKSSGDQELDVNAWFALEEREGNLLFYPGDYIDPFTNIPIYGAKKLGATATAKQVAENIRTFATNRAKELV